MPRGHVRRGVPGRSAHAPDHAPNLPPANTPAPALPPRAISALVCNNTLERVSIPGGPGVCDADPQGVPRRPEVCGIPTTAGPGRLSGGQESGGTSAEACLPQPVHAVLQDADAVGHISELRLAGRSEALNRVLHA